METDSLDADGAVVATHDMAGVTLADARRAVAEHLVGDIEQVPPMVSAIRIDGRRLHELAREGVEVDRRPRPVTVEAFDVTATDDPAVLAIDVVCSSGTYVRTLAADLGHLLGGGAHLRNLRRTAVGPFTIDEAADPDSCALLAPIEAVRGMATVVVDDGRRGADRQRAGAAGPGRRRAVGDDRPRRPAARRLRALSRGPGQAGRGPRRPA